MSYITAEGYELLGFFETEPSVLDKYIPWVYTDSLYEVTQGSMKLSVAIQPAYKDIHIILKESENKIFEFEAMGVQDIRVINDKPPEILEITVNEQQTVLIKIKPFISVYQTINKKLNKATDGFVTSGLLR